VGVALLLLVAGVDWSTGLVTATGVGVADRHAPSPAVARGTSRRAAEDAARVQLAREVSKLAKLDAGVVKALVADAFSVAAYPDTDGSWTVTMAVPLEAIRLARSSPGPRAWTDDKGPPVLVVEGAKLKPALLDVPAIFVDKVPDWAKDAPRVKKPEGGGPGTLYVISSAR